MVEMFENNPILRPLAGPTRRRVLRGLAGAAAVLGCGAPAFAATRTLRIGSTFDNSGVERPNGSALHLGATAFLAALNKAGGVAGARVELVMADDQFKPEVAKSNALAFGADKSILALLHPLGTRQTAAVMEAVQDMAVVGPNTGTVALRRRGAANVFWVRANYDQEVEKLVGTAATLGIKNIGLVHPNDPLGQSLLAAFNAATTRFQLQPGVIATTPNTTSLEVDAAAREIAKTPPQVVVMGLAGTAPAFVRALRAAGCTSPIYGLSIGASATNIKALGDASRGLGFSIVVPSPFASKHEIVRRYQTDMQALGSTDFSLPSLEGYINARVLIEGLRRAGGTPTRESVIAALESLESLDLGGLRIGFGKDRREGSNFVDVAVVGVGGRMIS
jgi:ABC-type branched-subunit amino acid transport system substrate-binding protein